MSGLGRQRKFSLHGSAKLLRAPHIPELDDVQLLSLLGGAGVLQLVEGILLVLGWLTRLVALDLSGEMAFAHFTAHATENTVPLPLTNRGEAAVWLCFIILFRAAAGGGAWSIGRLRAQK